MRHREVDFFLQDSLFGVFSSREWFKYSRLLLLVGVLIKFSSFSLSLKGNSVMPIMLTETMYFQSIFGFRLVQFGNAQHKVSEISWLFEGQNNESSKKKRPFIKNRREISGECTHTWTLGFPFRQIIFVGKAPWIKKNDLKTEKRVKIWRPMTKSGPDIST